MKLHNRFLCVFIGYITPTIAMASYIAADSFYSDGQELSSVTDVVDTSRICNLDELVIVSQSKENAFLREQPVASSIFSLSGITTLGIKDLRDLSSFVPSFQMPAYGSRLTSSMYMRGTGARINNPAVGIYTDGIPLLSKSAYNFHVYQTERIDVLRGPQGTLYGMNSEGGLIKLYSKNPLAYNGIDIKLGLGTGLYRNAEIASYNMVAEHTAISVAGFYNGQNGFFKNYVTGEKADLYNESGGKIRLVSQFNNRSSLDLVADYQYVNQKGFPYGQFDITTEEVSSPSCNRLGGYRRNMLNTALNLKHVFQYVTFNSATSYQFLSDNMIMDQDYTSLDFMHLIQKQLQNGVTQEFVMRGNNTRGWKHTSGVYGSYMWMRTEAPVFFDSEFTNNMSNTIQTAMYEAILKSVSQRFPGLPEDQSMAIAARVIDRAGGVQVTDLSMSVPGIFHTPQFNVGLFHESSYNLNKYLTMTIGLRYDCSHVKIDYATSAVMNVGVNVMSATASSSLRSKLRNSKCNSFNQILPKLGLTWQLSDNGSNIYALVSKGYRSGGYNIQMFSDILQTELRNNSSAMRNDYDIEHTPEDYDRINQTIAYKPEESWNYELGSHLNLFRKSMHADFAVYYMKIRNRQLSVMAGRYGFGRMMVNAGESHSCGFEASVRGKAFSNRLSWNATYSFINSVFDKYQEDSINYNGKKVPFIPQHSMSAAADWSIYSGKGKLQSVTVGANISAQGKTYWDEANTYAQRFYVLLGTRIDVNLKSLTVSLWCKNLTNTEYNTFAFSSNATGVTRYFAQHGNPFQIGVELGIHL